VRGGLAADSRGAARGHRLMVSAVTRCQRMIGAGRRARLGNRSSAGRPPWPAPRPRSLKRKSTLPEHVQFAGGNGLDEMFLRVREGFVDRAVTPIVKRH
jgi:hypothetical protein